ncbi:hypothetical protein JHK85_042905 [Glycine max]|uniref:Uncharacterized protein n=1 Tax=Glycine soja TaxID=3848 RepID=A0A0B2R173_GLYSO|nr:hypothetical protein JHK85_042905 [Glycine max]KHN25783.1 hypothetical protein glysoja_050327 [Glycine soja]
MVVKIVDVSHQQKYDSYRKNAESFRTDRKRRRVSLLLCFARSRRDTAVDSELVDPHNQLYPVVLNMPSLQTALPPELANNAIRLYRECLRRAKYIGHRVWQILVL